MPGFTLKQSRPPQNDPRHRRTRLGVEALEGRDVPSVVVYSNTFDWNGVAEVAVTVTADAPGHEGQYLWNYHLTNESLATGIYSFALPAEDSEMVSDPDSSVDWFPTVGTFLGDPDLVAWLAGDSESPGSPSGGGPLALGQSADFWFTTAPADLALTNGLLSTFGPTTTNAGLVAAPIPQGQGLPQAPLPAILVATREDKYTPNMGLTSLREAMQWVTDQNLPAQQLQVRFTLGMKDNWFDLNSELPLITTNIFINGMERNITVQRNAPQGDFRLIQGTDVSKIKIAGLALQKGNVPDGNGGAILTAGDLTLQDCTAQENSAGKGGAIYCEGDLTIERVQQDQNCIIRDNTARDSGGGIYAAGSLVISGGVVIRDNTAVDSGGGIYAAGTADIRNAYIYLNRVGFLIPLPGFGLGGGVYIGPNSTQAVIAGSEIFSNTADGMGGGVYVAGGSGSGGPTTDVTIRDCQIYQNNSQKGGGVAVGVDGSSILRLEEGTTIAYNAASAKGGGVYMGAGTLVTTSVAFIANSAPVGGGLYGVTGATWASVDGAYFFGNDTDDVNVGAA